MKLTGVHVLLSVAALTLVACSGNVDDPGRYGSRTGPNGETILNIDPALVANEGTAPETDEYIHLVTPDLAVCPSGARFDEVGGFCVMGTQALGPFPAAMVATCQKLGGGAQCATTKWELDLARRARGEDFCPAGSLTDLETGLCADDRYVYGPFDLTMIKECRLTGGGAQCDELRWDKWFAPLLTAEDAASNGGATFKAVPAKLDEACGSNSKLFNYYKSQNGFMDVRRAARAKLAAIGEGTSARPDRNGCATYLSYALKKSGAVADMPIEPGTEGFRDALLKRGWKVIQDPAQFQPGDVIISRDRKGVPGHPDHVYMYAGSKDGAPGMGYVIDNQGTMVHERNVSAQGSKTRAAYALRAPNAKSGESCAQSGPVDQRDSCVGKADGWFCSDIKDFSSYQCKAQTIVLGNQCATGRTCTRINPSSPDDDRAQMDGQLPACGTQSAPTTSGQSCTSDGECNPGSNGSGKICAAGKCVAGCNASYQCPGTSTCQAGQCAGGSSGTGGTGGTGTGGTGGTGTGGTGGTGTGGSSSPQSFSAKGTGYYPSNTGVEGGFKDRLGAKLNTLQDFLAGKATYVSVAMDPKAFPYGTKMRIDELDRKFGKTIEFRVVDTGGAFYGKGTSRLDVCTGDKSSSMDPTINGTLTVRVIP